MMCSERVMVMCIHLTPLNPRPDLPSLRTWSLASNVYVALRCGSTRPSTIGDAIAPLSFFSSISASWQEMSYACKLRDSRGKSAKFQYTEGGNAGSGRSGRSLRDGVKRGLSALWSSHSRNVGPHVADLA